MHLTLSPIHGLPGQPETTLSVTGDTITIDGTAYDLSPVPEGGAATAPDATPFDGPITRRDGVINARLRVLLGDNAADDQPSDPDFWVIETASGDVEIPAIRKEMTE